MTSLFPSPGPLLPSFRSLLIKGKYHASAPIHLCLSHALQPETTKVVLMASSCSALTGSLKQLADEWIKLHGGEGRVSGAASKVDVLYPPTPAHLTFLLSLFHEALSGQQDFLHEKTTFSSAPSLIVLCDVALYFSNISEATVSSYLMLMTRALATVSSLSTRSGRCTSLVVFDSTLDSLKLPLVRPVSPGQENVAGSSSPIARREPLGFLAQRYFEWTGTVEEDAANRSEDDEELVQTDVKRVCTLRLQRVSGSEPEEISQRWTERIADDGGTTFTWPV